MSPLIYGRGSDRVAGLHRSPAAAKTAHEKTVIQRQIDVTDRQIDQLVYRVYALGGKRIGIVEEATF